MRRHLLLLTFTLILSHFSISNLWAGEQLRRIWKYAAMVLLFFMIGVGNAYADIDWSGYSYLGDGASGGAQTYANKYKIALAANQGVDNIQHPGFATADGIYTTFPNAPSYCSLGPCNYDIQGAGMILHVDAFTAKETEVKVTANGVDYVFTVYYEDGETGGDNKVLSFIYTMVGSKTAGRTPQTTCNGGAADADKCIYDSDFKWNQTNDNVAQRTVGNIAWTGIDPSQACTRADVSFSAGKYIITLLTYRTNHPATMTLPSISINGGDAITAKEARWNCGASTETIVNNQFTYTNDNSKGAFQTEVELVYDTTIASAGSYGISISFPSGYDRAKDYIQTLTIEKEDAAESVCPSAYSFTYKNGSSAWSDPICFTNTETGDGNGGYYWTAECTLPTDGVSFKLGWEGADNAENAKTVEVDYSYMPYELQRTKTFGVHPTSENTGGAEGYLRVRSSYGDNNKYIGFIPAGYVLRTGSGESWSSTNFVPASEDYDETDWSTPLTTLSSSTAAKHYYVGLKTSSGYVWSNAYSEDWSRLIFLQTKGTSSTGWRADGAKMQLHYWKNGGGVDAYITMTDDDGDGVYEAWLPNVSYDRIQFKRLSSDMKTVYNQTGDLEFQSDKNMYIIEENFTQTGWGVYDQAGKFHIYANSSDKNWYLRFKPHYVLEYNANGGSGAPEEQSVAIDAVSKSVTVAAGSGMTAPTGYEFNHWDTQVGDDGTDYAAGASYTLSADATLYAQWTAKQSTITFDKEGGSSGSDGATGTYGSAMPSITAPTRTGYDFGGYWDGDNGTGNQYYKADGTSYAIWNKDTEDGTTLYAKWTAKSYTVTLYTNDGTINAGNVTSYTYGEGATLPTNVTKSGNRFMGWYDNSSFTGSPVTTISTSATENKEYWARWATLYTITNGNPSNGTINVNSTAIEGETVSILATPSSGYAFNEWSIYKTGDASTTIDPASATASTTFTMPAYEVTVTATFAETTCTNNKVIQCENSNVGASVTIINSGEAHPTPASATVSTDGDGYNGSGYLKMGSGSSDVGDAYFPFSVSQDNTLVTITVRYKKANAHSYANIFEKVDAATGHIQYNGAYYNKHSFEHIGGGDNWSWPSDFTDYSFNRTLYNKDYILVICDHDDGEICLDQITLAAGAGNDVFCEETSTTYDVTVNRNNDSYGTVTGANTYTAGETVTITATPQSGYGFVNWTTSDDVTFADANSASTTFTMPSKNVTVQANFAELRTVNFEVFGGNGSISAKRLDTDAAISSGAQVPSGTRIRFTATPNPGYNVQGWYTYQSSTEVQQGNDVNTTFDYIFNVSLTMRVKFTQIRIATGNKNIGSTDGYADSEDGSTIETTNVDDPEGKFSHKVLQVDYKMVSANDQASYRGISLPVDNGYTTSIASGKSGMGFWYRTESTTDKVLTYFCIGGTDGSHQFETLLPATNGKWQYWYIATDYVDDNTTFGFYINGTKNSKSTGTINANAKFWLSEVEPITPADVTVLGDETKEIAPIVRDLTIYQGGEVTNSEDVIVTRNIYYHRHAKGGALSNKLDQWYTFAVPFTVSDIEVNESSTWYDINAVYYSDNNDNQSDNPDGPGHFYLQYLSATNVSAMGSEFADRWRYITPNHSLYLDANAADWDGSRYGYPMKDSAYIILFDSDQPIGTYFQTNTEIRFVGGAQTIDGTAKEWKVVSDGEEYYLYANNTLHNITLTGSAYVLNDAGTNFDLQETPTIRPFECYVQGTDELKAKYQSLPMRRPGGGGIVTGMEKTGLEDSVQVIKVIEDGRLIIIRNGRHYNAMGARVK